MHDLLAYHFSSQWRVFFFNVLFLMVLTEFGFRIGRRSRARLDDANKGQVGTLQGAVLGLLALLLGFTFAMAVQRYDTRRGLIVQEANAIGTTYLRADFLPEPERTEVRALLATYTAVRLEGGQSGTDVARLADAVHRSGQIQDQLWALGSAGAGARADALAAGFIESLNSLIDISTLRLAASRNHVPTPVWLLVSLVAGCGACACGYGVGTGGRRLGISQVLLPVLISVVITILVDLDSPRRGLLGLSQQTLIDLKQWMADQNPPPRP